MSFHGENIIIGYFSPVNESVWEHLKLVFFPMIIWSSIEYLIIGKIFENFIVSKTIGILSSIIFIIVSFYTYSGIVGSHIFIIDILIFVFSIIIGELIAYYLIKNNKFSYENLNKISITILLIILLLFIIFTYNPLDLKIFMN